MHGSTRPPNTWEEIWLDDRESNRTRSVASKCRSHCAMASRVKVQELTFDESRWWHLFGGWLSKVKQNPAEISERCHMMHKTQKISKLHFLYFSSAFLRCQKESRMEENRRSCGQKKFPTPFFTLNKFSLKWQTLWIFSNTSLGGSPERPNFFKGNFAADARKEERKN